MFLKKSFIKKLAIATFIGIVILGSVGCSSTKANSEPAYEIYPTENVWNLLELDTRTGIIFQVQYGINEKGGRMKTSVNSKPLVDESQAENGRFKLYPTQNMYNFILLDQIDGRTWQVQWSTEPENRGIVAEIK